MFHVQSAFSTTASRRNLSDVIRPQKETENGGSSSNLTIAITPEEIVCYRSATAQREDEKQMNTW
jgi:hypothetical protein